MIKQDSNTINNLISTNQIEKEMEKVAEFEMIGLLKINQSLIKYYKKSYDSLARGILETNRLDDEQKKNIFFLGVDKWKSLPAFAVKYLDEPDFFNKFMNLSSLDKIIKLTMKDSPMTIRKIVKNNINLLNSKCTGYYDEGLIEYLESINYVYKPGDSPKYLINSKKLTKLLIMHGDITLLFENNIPLDEELIDLLISKINNIDYSLIILNNKYLENNKKILEYINSKYQVDEYRDMPFNLKISSTNRAISKYEVLNQYKDSLTEHVINNNVLIDLDKIIEILGEDNFINIYNKLYLKDGIPNKNFNIYHFINVMLYFTKNMNLLNELKENGYDENIINNLTLVIDKDELVNYEKLISYKEDYCNTILNSNLSAKDKISNLIFMCDYSELIKFNNEITNTNKLAYLQLEYQNDEKIVNLLNNYSLVFTLIEKLNSEEYSEIEVLESIKNSNNIPNNIFNLNAIKSNLLYLYSKLYSDNKMQKNKIINENGYDRIYVDGEEEFMLFYHNEEFNENIDEYSSDSYESIHKRANYICTTFLTNYNIEKIYNKREVSRIFEMDSDSLIAFGDKDIYIYQTKMPFYKSNDRFVDPIAMSFTKNKSGYVDNEFDFLRVNSLGKKFVETNKYIFDIDKINENNIKRYNNLKSNINNLSWKELYLLICLSFKLKLELDYEYIYQLLPKYNELEQKVLTNALIEYTDIKIYNGKHI